MAALESARQLNDLHFIAYCVDDAAKLVVQRIAEQNASGQEDREKLAGVFGAVDHWREMLALRRTPSENLSYQQITETLQNQLGEALYLRAQQESRSIPAEKVIKEVIELLETTLQPEPDEKQSTIGEEAPGMLSEREREVIGLVAEGLTNQEIGEHLFITERTVRFHLTSIFNKLEANNRGQAVAIANRMGFL